MSTRQLRLNTPDEIRKRLGQFTGKKINIVLSDQTVCLVILLGFDGSVLKVSNMRLKTTSIPLSRISEIYFDTRE
jgi:hypothetical protein